MRTRTRPMAGLLAVGMAIAGCGGSDAVVVTGPPPAATGAPAAGATSSPAASAKPAAIEQAFASADPDVAFRDPDRRKKLETAFPLIAAAVEDEVKKQGLASLSVGVVIDGELAFSTAAGFADVTKKTKPDADTIYRIGSITKSFTALALLSLRDEGALSLDDPLAKWIPEASKIVYPTRDALPITLRQMLTHTAGLPRESSYDFEHDPSEALVLGELAKTSLAFTPGTRSMYSNLGYVLLGLTVGRAAGSSVREAVKKRILEPLGMTSTAYDLESVDQARVATPYRLGPGGLEAAAHWKVGATAGAGALFSSVRDMARYVAMQTDAYPARSTPDKGPIRRSSIREAHGSALPVGLHVEMADAPEKGESLVNASADSYGYGWVVSQRCDFPDRIGHGGGMTGYISEITFFRARGVGLVALTNTVPVDMNAIVERILTLLRRSGGMSARSDKPTAAFDASVKKLIAVQNTWNEAAYHEVVEGTRDPAEKDELEGYKKLHGACSGYSVLEMTGPHSARLALQCERGPFEMSVQLNPDDTRFFGFSGLTRDVPIPEPLKKVADRVVGLIEKWDDGVFKKNLAKLGRPREAIAKELDALRAAHRSCAVKSSNIEVFDRTLVLECAQGTGLRLSLEVDPKDPNSVTRFSFQKPEQGTCPVK